MVKNYLNKGLLVLLASLFLFAAPVSADEATSSLFIKITDATTAVKKNDQEEAKQLVNDIKEEFEKIEHHDSAAGKKVSQALEISGEVTEGKLEKVSSALLAFEKEQNPVDLDSEKKKLVNALTPKFSALSESIKAEDIEQVSADFNDLNATWTRNEAVVRNESSAHYGKIETAISLLRSSIAAEPTDYDSIQTSADDLKAAIDSFVKGEEATDSSNSDLTLSDGIKMLEQALASFKKGDKQKASATMKEFITIWPTIEGDVSTRNPALYTRVESQSPVIMVKGDEKKYQQQLQSLIDDLSEIDTSANYNFFDVMLILLREGVEALLIVMALVTTLKTAKMKKGLKWVYSGAALGVIASAVIAFILSASLSSAVSSGTNREIIEGIVGIFAVLMMILIGIWLHSKSSVQKWNEFMDRQMKTVTATGSFISMFGLSFLAVFREGAETILFYAGIYPRTDTSSFFLGIALAVLVLAIIAIVMNKASDFFKPHKMFFWLTWLIYALAFKMLGVSIHALQLTNMASNHLINGFPTIEWAGIYPSWEVIGSQLIFLAVIAWVTLRNREKKHG